MLTLLLVLSSCATSISDSSKSSDASFRLSIPVNALVSRGANVTLYKIVCKLSGSVEFEDSKEVSGQQSATFEFSEIPVGKKLTIEIEIYDQAGALCFVGKETTIPKEKDNNVVMRLSKPDSQASIKYQVGDLILTDGSIIPYTANQTFTAEQVSSAVAVIFKASTYNTPALGVGVKQKQGEWAFSGTAGNGTNFNELYGTKSGSTFTGYTDGSDSWQRIYSVDANATLSSYPAFEFAENYSSTYVTNLVGTSFTTGWYVPTISEFYDISQRMNKVYEVLQALGGVDPVEKNNNQFFGAPVQQVSRQWYWTSNQGTSDTKAYYAQYVNGNFSCDGSYGKSEIFYVLVIRKFN